MIKYKVIIVEVEALIKKDNNANYINNHKYSTCQKEN
jgi:hypothetical protein